MAPIYKILTQDDWTRFQSSGTYRGSPVDLADGYIHFSTREQLVETLDKHYRGQSSLEILAIETSALNAENLKWEPARGSLFPHLYTDLPLSAVISSFTLSAGSDGLFALPEDMGA